MIVSGEEYSKKLATFSDDTMRLIMEINTLDIERIRAKTKIIEETETEAEIVRKLKKLRDSK